MRCAVGLRRGEGDEAPFGSTAAGSVPRMTVSGWVILDEAWEALGLTMCLRRGVWRSGHDTISVAMK